MAIAFNISSLAAIPERVGDVIGLIMGEPLVYIPLLSMWLLFELYYIVSSSDSDVKESDLLENSVSSIYIAVMISPLFGDEGFSLAAFSNPSARTWLSIILFCYAAFLIIMAFTKMLPQFLVHVFGGASLDMFGTMLALIWVDGSIPIDLATIAVLLIPILLMQVFGFFRRMARGY
ncbi:hypothetical protein HYV81_05110 [Candidatus Woesearchaeota archaeon]|nr:hypothetical protein [Candidatus Woesearchaeota archaeon]